MQTMKPVIFFVLAAASLCTLAQALAAAPKENNSLPRLSKRKAKPRFGPLTLEQLRYSCSAHGWSDCRRETEKIFNDSSAANAERRECLRRVVQQRTVQVKIKPLTDVDDVSLANGNNGGNSPRLINTVSSNTDASKCTVTMQQKNDARELYCMRFALFDLLFLINMNLWLNLDNIYGGYLHIGCVSFYNSADLLTQEDILNRLIEWHKQMKRDHLLRDCCAPYINVTLNENYNEISIPSCPTQWPVQWKKVVTNMWGRFLSNFAWMMHEVNSLEAIGRRRKCLRGCVAEEEVNCCQMFDHENSNFLLPSRS